MISPCWMKISEINRCVFSTLSTRVLILSCNSLLRVLQYRCDKTCRPGKGLPGEPLTTAGGGNFVRGEVIRKGVVSTMWSCDC